MSASSDPIEMRFPGERETKRKLRKRVLAAQIEAARRVAGSSSGFAVMVLDNAAYFAGRWTAAPASEQQLQDVLIGLAGLFVAANALERAADGQPY